MEMNGDILKNWFWQRVGTGTVDWEIFVVKNFVWVAPPTKIINARKIFCNELLCIHLHVHVLPLDAYCSISAARSSVVLLHSSLS